MDYPTLSPGSMFEQCLTAATFGIASHLLFFIRGQRDRQALSIIIYHGLLGTASLAIQMARSGVVLGCFQNLVISTSYFAGLVPSMVIYRLFFHPLRQFPGPLAAKVTNLFALHLNQNGKMHEGRAKLFEKHGDFVRVGES
jgi:hypothetical protein